MAEFGVKIAPVLDTSGAGVGNFKNQLRDLLWDVSRQADAKIKIKAQLDSDPSELRGQLENMLEGLRHNYIAVGAGLSLYAERNVREEINSMLRRIEESANHIQIFGDASDIAKIATEFKETGDFIRQTTEAMSDFGSTLSRAIDEFAGLQGVGEYLDTINARLSAMTDLITKISEKNFNIQNILQPGGDTQAVSQLRVYREEAMELAKYVNKLYTAFLNVGHISSDIFRVDKLRDAINDLSTMNMDNLFKKIGDTDSIGQIDALRSQLLMYKESLEQIIEITKSNGIDIPMPDNTKLKQAIENVKIFDEQAQKAAEALTKEAAAAQGAATSLGEVSAKSAEIKIEAPTAGESFDLIRSKIDEIMELLPRVQEALQSAFDVSVAISNVQNLKGQFEELRTTISSLADLTLQNLASGTGEIKPIESAQMASIRTELEQINSLADAASQKMASAFNFDNGLTSIQTMRQSFEELVQHIGALADNVRIISGEIGHVVVPAEASNALNTILQTLNGISVALQDVRTNQEAAFNLTDAIARVNELAQSYATLAQNVRTWNQVQRHNVDAGNGNGGTQRNIANWEMRVQRLQVQLNKLSTYAPSNKFLDNLDAVNRYQEALRAAQDRLNALATATGNERNTALLAFNEQIEVVRQLREELNQTAKWEAKFTGNNGYVARLQNLAPSNAITSADQQAIERYTNAWNALRDSINQARNTENPLLRASAEQQIRQNIAVLQQMRTEINNAAADLSNLEAVQNRAAQLANKIDIWKQNNPNAYRDASAQIDDYLNRLRNGIPLAREELAQIENGFKRIAETERIAGNNGQTFFQQLNAGWRKFGGWSIVSRSFMSVIRIFKQGVTAVKEVDAAMTELRKVTELTNAQYDQFYDKAVKIATDVGAKLSDTISATADFSRLGYNIRDAASLAEASLMYANVGDSIESIDEATSSLISTMKAFGIEAKDAMSIVDMFNEVGKTLLPMPVVTRCLAECYIGQSSIALCA